MTTEEKLKHFLETSIESATNKSTKIIEDYKQSLNHILESHMEDARRKAELQIKLGADSLEREKNKELSKAQIAIKKEITKKQEEIKEKLFIEVKDMLETFMATRSYHALLVSQIKEAKAFAKDEEIIIYIDPADSSELVNLETSANTHLKVSEYSFGGGTRAVINARNILIDNSFETKLKEAREAFTFINK